MSVPNVNGALVLLALRNQEGPVPMEKLIETIGKVSCVNKDDLDTIVKDTVNVGEAYGFLKRRDGGYVLPQNDHDVPDFDATSVSYSEGHSQNDCDAIDYMADYRASFSHSARHPAGLEFNSSDGGFEVLFSGLKKPHFPFLNGTTVPDNDHNMPSGSKAKPQGTTANATDSDPPLFVRKVRPARNPAAICSSCGSCQRRTRSASCPTRKKKSCRRKPRRCPRKRRRSCAPKRKRKRTCSRKRKPKKCH